MLADRAVALSCETNLAKSASISASTSEPMLYMYSCLTRAATPVEICESMSNSSAPDVSVDCAPTFTTVTGTLASCSFASAYRSEAIVAAVSPSVRIAIEIFEPDGVPLASYVVLNCAGNRPPSRSGEPACLRHVGLTRVQRQVVQPDDRRDDAAATRRHLRRRRVAVHPVLAEPEVHQRGVERPLGLRGGRIRGDEQTVAHWTRSGARREGTT